MIVSKFGGTSVSTPQKITNLCRITEKRLKRNPIVVVSAIAGVTDLLLEITQTPKDSKKSLEKIKKIHSDLVTGIFKGDQLKEVANYIDQKLLDLSKIARKQTYEKSEIDEILSFGEIMSSYIAYQALEQFGIAAKQVIATEIIVTNDNFNSADFLPAPTKQKVKKVLLPIISAKIVPVITGFIGSTKGGKTITLGRGGSDYTAAIIGFSLNAEEIEIWTDVDGIFTTDPKIAPKAKLIRQISYKEASELAAFGAKVLHPRTIKPAVKGGIAVRVLNTQDINCQGTLICDKPDLKNPITAISFKRRVTLVNIYSTEMLFSKGFLAKIFKVFTKHNISIDLVSVSEVTVSVTLENHASLTEALEELSTFSTVSTSSNFGMVSLIGEGVATSSKTIRKIFDILDKKKILVKMISLGASDINVSLVIQYDQIEEAVKILHNKLLIKNLKTK